MPTPAVAGFDRVTFTHQGRSHPVDRAGSGPAVIVIHEIPGIHPGMVSFAQRLIAAGYTVYLPVQARSGRRLFRQELADRGPGLASVPQGRARPNEH
jgi:dienelactone hydrolase